MKKNLLVLSGLSGLMAMGPFLVMAFGFEVGPFFGFMLLGMLIAPILAIVGYRMQPKGDEKTIAGVCLFATFLAMLLSVSKFVNG